MARYNYDAYEDGSSCDEEHLDAKADAEGENRMQRAWYIEMIVQAHLKIHSNYSWTAEELLEDLSHDMDRKGIESDDDERLEVIQEILSRKEGV